MRLSILIFDGVTVLDAVGGYEVLARVPGVEVEFVARDAGVIAADTRRLGLLAWRSFDEVRATDILYMPGGPGALALETDPAFLDYLRLLDAHSTWTVGICNGVVALAAAGLLAGRRATTNWFDRGRLAAHGATFVAARHHCDGKYLTGAGVSASIDTGLHLARTIAGDSLAMALQLGLEYYPQPPFAHRTPGDTPEGLQRAVQRFHDAGAAPQLAVRAPFAGRYGVIPPSDGAP